MQVTAGTAILDKYAVQVLTAREYLRNSKKRRKNKQRSITGQHTDNVRRSTPHNIKIVGKAYVDEDLSASRYSTKVRDEFEELLSDLRNGTFGARVLVLWEISRGSRQLEEWVTLLGLCERAGVLIFVTDHGRLYNPADGRDRRSLLEEAMDSEYETYKLHRRLTRDTAFQAELGRPHGMAPHGMRPLYNENTRELINWVENKDESMVPKELFRLLRAGVSLRKITQTFAKRGYKNRSGNPFGQQHLRSMAKTYAYAGLRIHIPNVAGQRGNRKDPDPTLYTATWDALVEPEVFWDVQTLLNDPSRRCSRTGRAEHELTRIMVCDVCGGPIEANHSRGRDIYECGTKHCVVIQRNGVNDFLLGTPDNPGVILRYLASPEVYEHFAASEEDNEELAQVRADLAKQRAERAKLKAASKAAESLDTAEAIGNALKNVRSAIARLEAKQRTLRTPGALAQFIEPGADVSERWAALDVSARREVIRLILTPGAMGQVRITRAVKGQRLAVIPRIRQVTLTEAA